MAQLSTMPAWEVFWRLGGLAEFRARLLEFYQNAEYDVLGGYEETPRCMELRQELNTRLSGVKKSITLAGIPTLAEINTAMFGNHVVDIMDEVFNTGPFGIHPQNAVDVIEQAIGVYRHSFIRSLCLTPFMPFIWLNRLIVWIIGYPFQILKDAGLVRRGDSLIGTLQSLFTLVGVICADVGSCICILEKLGLLDSVKDYVHKVI